MGTCIGVSESCKDLQLLVFTCIYISQLNSHVLLRLCHRSFKWVLISQKKGNSATTCMGHADLEGDVPDWGLTSDKPWLKKHIMCCKVDQSSV
jgi:hypothetical protein